MSSASFKNDLTKLLEASIESHEKALVELKARLDEAARIPVAAVPLPETAAQKAAKLPVPYAPGRGQFTVFLNGKPSEQDSVVGVFSSPTFAAAGLEYRDEANARVAWAKARHLLLLMRLAHDLNPNGEVTGDYLIKYDRDCWIVAGSGSQSNRVYVDSVFINMAAAEEACKILNRDGVVPPGIQKTETSSS